VENHLENLRVNLFQLGMALLQLRESGLKSVSAGSFTIFLPIQPLQEVVVEPPARVERRQQFFLLRPSLLGKVSLNGQSDTLS
jgi:hypothetical protein